MTELLGNLDVLTRPVLALPGLTLAGVAFGGHGRSIPRERIIEVSGSPLVKSSQSGTNIEPTYFDASGAKIPLARVIESVIDAADGMLHFADGISFKLVSGQIAGFALYGRQGAVFGTLKSPDAVIAMFGTPDRSRENHAYGDLMGHDFHYAGSRKQVSWDAFGHRISLVNFGDYPWDP